MNANGLNEFPSQIATEMLMVDVSPLSPSYSLEHISFRAGNFSARSKIFLVGGSIMKHFRLSSPEQVSTE